MKTKKNLFRLSSRQLIEQLPYESAISQQTIVTDPARSSRITPPGVLRTGTRHSRIDLLTRGQIVNLVLSAIQVAAAATTIAKGRPPVVQPTSISLPTSRSDLAFARDFHLFRSSWCICAMGTERG